jgi:hypothetical protein
MVDGAFVADATGVRIVVGVDSHPDHGPLERTASTQVHASLCGACGFIELYANRPAELTAAYRSARPKDSS